MGNVYTQATEDFVRALVNALSESIGVNIQQVYSSLNELKADKELTPSKTDLDNAINNLAATINAHILSGNIHVSKSEKDEWNAKVSVGDVYLKQYIDETLATKSEVALKLDANKVVSPNSASNNTQAASAKYVFEKIQEINDKLLVTLKDDDVEVPSETSQEGAVASAKGVYDNFGQRYFKLIPLISTMRGEKVNNAGIIKEIKMPRAEFDFAGTVKKIRIHGANNDSGIWTRVVKLMVYGQRSDGTRVLIASSKSTAEMPVGGYGTFEFDGFSVIEDFPSVIMTFVDASAAQCLTRIGLAPSHPNNGFGVSNAAGQWLYNFAPAIEIVGNIEVNSAIIGLFGRLQKMKEVMCLNEHSTENDIIERFNQLINAIQGVN